MAKKSKLKLDKIDKEIIKEALTSRKKEIIEELETYNAVQGKLRDISLKRIKGLNWIAWVWAIPVIIVGVPSLLGFFMSNYIEKIIITIFKALKRLTYALINDIKKFIKSKFGN
jgi:hypothetical protein